MTNTMSNRSAQLTSTTSDTVADAATETEFVTRVIDRRDVATGVISLRLARADGTPMPAWQPGAHIDVLLDADLTRQYSVCGDQDDRESWQIGVLRELAGRGGSAFIHDNVTVGTELRVRGPRNHFELTPAPRYTFIAGGIGITPILPMIRQCHRDGADWHLWYGGRSSDSMAFSEEILELGEAEHVTLVPQDVHGTLDLRRIIGGAAADTAVYCCGPEALLQAVERECAGTPACRLYVERFAPTAGAESAANDSFEVELAASGTTLSVPADRTVLDVLVEAGVDIVSSCAEGICGTCEVAVMGGKVDHRDSVLSDDEREANTSMFVCVSRSLSPKLVLDL
jgi:ferredoxin-NADP reductase